MAIRKKLNQLVNHMNEKYPDKKSKRLYHRFKDTILKEFNPNEESVKKQQTSYTINKGDTMVLCLRRIDGGLVDLNTLMYVAIHELAHIYSSSLHHSQEFWQNMAFLLTEANKIGIYQKVNYAKNPVRYCGLTIKSSIPS